MISIKKNFYKLFYFIFLLAYSYACLTDIIPENRIDCHPEPYDQNRCVAIGCTWCSNVASDIAQCFLNVSSNFDVLWMASHKCRSVVDCDIAINCHPDQITYFPNEDSCKSRGCLWLGDTASATRPRCVYYNNSILGHSLFVGAFPMFEIASICKSCDKCFYKLNCLPNEPRYRITQRRCQREGCIWCETSQECLFGMNSALDILVPQCRSCSDCPIQAYIKSTSQSVCETRGGTYCNNRPRTPDDRRCALMPNYSPGECSLEKALLLTCRSCEKCDTPINCSKLGIYESQMTCVERGCMWCLNSKNSPSCIYGSSGYRCISKNHCDIQFPRFQNIDWSLHRNQRPHLLKLMEVLCYSQLGVWAPNTDDKCLSASPILMSPLMRKLKKLFLFYHYMYYHSYSRANSETGYD